MTLSSKVSSLTGPDRAVDAEVAVALGMRRDGNMFYTEHEDFVLERDYYDIEGSARELPHFTASLDAAMTVVPEKFRDDFIITSSGAYLGPDYLYFTENVADFYSFGTATPVLALLSAALAARGL